MIFRNDKSDRVAVIDELLKNPSHDQSDDFDVVPVVMPRRFLLVATISHIDVCIGAIPLDQDGPHHCDLAVSFPALSGASEEPLGPVSPSLQ